MKKILLLVLLTAALQCQCEAAPQTPSPTVTVTKAGDPNANGIYEMTDLVNGRPFYAKGTGGEDSGNIYWDGQEWILQMSLTSTCYISFSDVDDPHYAKNWQAVYTTQQPAPKVK